MSCAHITVHRIYLNLTKEIIMERFVYANAFGFIVVFAEYVSLLRNEPVGATWSMVIAILVFALNISSLYDERSYVSKPINRFVDFPAAPVDNRGHHYGL
jgi:hypothetical protein